MRRLYLLLSLLLVPTLLRCSTGAPTDPDPDPETELMIASCTIQGSPSTGNITATSFEHDLSQGTLHFTGRFGAGEYPKIVLAVRNQPDVTVPTASGLFTASYVTGPGPNETYLADATTQGHFVYGERYTVPNGFMQAVFSFSGRAANGQFASCGGEARFYL